MFRTKRSLIAKIVGLVVYFLLVFVASRAQVSSDFSSGADGWTVLNGSSGATSAPVYNASGGNPGGYISTTLTTTNVQLSWNAPAKFLGNISRAYNQVLSFDLLQSTAGTDNTQNDVEIIGGGVSIVYQLPSKPGTSWTHYSIPINETFAGWHSSTLFGPTPSQVQMKLALANATNFRIRLKYNNTSSSYTAQLDNVVLNELALGAPPVVTSFSPASALAGSTVTLTGANFNTTPSQNAVYFNGVKATATSASATQLQVTVPTSAAFGPITVTDLNSGLHGSSVQSFNPLFDNNKDFGGRIIPASMARGYNVVLPMNSAASNTFGRMDKGDLDGDGRIDFVTTETSTAKIYSFQNLGAAGAVSIASYGPATALPSLASIPGGTPYLAEVLIVDVDNDGKPDVAASTANNTTGFLAVYRNTSTVGSISFASPVFFSYNYYSALSMAAGDLDVDGRTDFAFTTGTAPGNIFISQNLSTPGNVDFSFGSSISGTSTSGLSDIAIADLTGDGKPEIICPGYNAATISIYQNNSTIGTISMGTVFTIPALVNYTVQIAIADLDADGKLDMTWSTYGSQYVYFAKNIYAGGPFDATAFGPTIQIANKLSNPLGITVGDINSDGKPDVVLSGYSDLGVMQNIGTGSLSATSFLPTTLFQGSATPSSNIGCLAPGVADLDGDNKPEAFFVSSSGPLAAGATGIYIFHNESFTPPSITGTSPTSANTGVTVALNGNYMFTANTTPMVRFNKTLATLSGAATNTLTSAITPVGGISGKFSVLNHGLTAFSPKFNSLFNTNRSITTSSFGPSVDFTLAFGPRDVLDVADFDDDGKIDVVISDSNGVGIFQNSTTPGQSITAASLALLSSRFASGANSIAYDIDGDGKADINGGSGIIQNTSSSSISFAANVFTPYSNPNGLALADFNKDGKVDLAMTNGTSNVMIIENQSSRGNFINSGSLSTYNPTSVNLGHPSGSAFGAGNQCLVAGDFDGDGYDDVAATSSSSNSFIFFRNLATYGPISGSSFSAGTAVAAASQPFGITANDFDGDGKIDLAVVHYNSSAINVYLNTSTVGSISFAAPINLSGGQTFGYNIGSQDLDGDGKAEIVTTRNPNPGTPSFSIFQNNSSAGSLSFGAAVTYTLVRYPQAIAFADINSDQKPDILVVASGGGPAPALMIFENKMVSPVITISTQPGSVYSVCDGATPTLTTAAIGTTNITYQWQILNTGSGAYNDLTNTGGYSNVGTSSLTINSAGNFGNGTYRCKVNGDYAATAYTNTVSFTVNALPPTPTASDVNNCGPGSVILTASGGTNGQYLWYDQNGLISGQTNNTYATSTITTTSGYSVAITNGTCVSPKTNITATINSVPTAPVSSDVANCGPGSVILTASGGTNGQYLWYDQNGLISGQTNNTYTTPSITTTSGYSVAITNGTCVSSKTSITATINTVPTAPISSDVANCGPGSVILTASGGTNGQYLWYDQNGLISGQTNNTYATSTITTTSGYSVAITNGACVSPKTNVNAIINAVPAAPGVQGASNCPGKTISLTASGGTNGQYRWYSVVSGGAAINGEVNSTYVTPVLTTTTTYYVSINNGTCESTRTPVIATIDDCPPPVIQSDSVSTQIGGKVTIDLKTLITTANLDLTSLQIISSPSSGASASIDANGILTIDYAGKSFSGIENIKIQACDANGQCAVQEFSIAVVGDIVVYNGISPEGANPKLILQYIEAIPETKNNAVYIFDRWENLVWHGSNYDNTSVVFTGTSDGGSSLPAGVYFYKITFASGRKTQTGFISLRR